MLPVAKIERSRSRARILQWIFAGLLLAILLFFGRTMLEIVTWFSLFDHFVQVFTRAGVPDELSAAISIWFIFAVVVLAAILPISMLWKRNRKTLMHGAVAAAAVSSWFVIQYFISLPKPGEYFNSITGEAKHNYARQPDGRIRLFYVRLKHDPKYNTLLSPITPEIVREYENQQSSPQVRPSSRPAPSNSLGQRQSASKPPQDPFVQTMRPTARVEALPIQPPDQRDNSSAQFTALVNTRVAIAPGKRNIAMFVLSAGPPVDFSPEDVLYGSLQSSKTNIITNSLQKEAFGMGYIDRLYSGDQELVRIITAGTRVDNLIFCRLTYSL